MTRRALPTPAQLTLLRTGQGTVATMTAAANAGWISRTAWREGRPMEITGMGEFVLAEMQRMERA